jgi:hypothetical protein
MACQRLAPRSAQTSHEIVDVNGNRVGFYANKSAAGRALSRLRRDWEGGWRPTSYVLGDDTINPRFHTIREVAK